MITENHLLPTVLENDWLQPDQVLAHRLTVATGAQRHANFHIRGTRDNDLFVKQGPAGTGVGTLANEALIYDWLQQSEATASIAPRFHGFRPDQGLLCVESLPYAEDLQVYHYQRRIFPSSVARFIGRALGVLHRASSPTTTPFADTMDQIPDMHPSVFCIPCPPIDILQRISAVGLEVLKMFGNHPVLAQSFTDLERNRKRDALIHGDVKLANFVAYKRDPSQSIDGVKLVDWEFAGWGDSRWDVASVFAAYLTTWLCSIPMTGRRTAAETANLACFDLANIQRFFSEFWPAYLRSRRLDAGTRSSFLQTTTRLTAVRLVQTAYELSKSTNEMTPQIATLMQVSVNILERPEEAQAQLLGLACTD